MTAKHCATFATGNVSHALTAGALLLACLFAITPLRAEHPAPQLSSNTDTANAGFFRLSWETDAERVELQEAKHPAFRNPRTYYSGPDRAAVISGKSNGAWYYRIRNVNAGQNGPWSETVTVTVDHHSLFEALMFFVLGLTVFVATTWMIVRGTRTSQ